MSAPTIHILREHEGIVAVSKPAGLPSTGRNLDDPFCAQHQVMEKLCTMAWALHQLDFHTSGLLLFTTRKALVKTWQSQWSSLQKSYLLFVHGRLKGNDWQRVDLPLQKAPRNVRRPMAVDPNGATSITDIRLLATSKRGPYSLLKARIQTGRTHQLRAHLFARNLPLIGEEVYTDIPCDYHPRTALHSHSIQTSPPLPILRFQAPLPDDLIALASRLEIPLPDFDSFPRSE